ncbi:STM4504/CBY_0614 family protein [Azospirillum brasilense]|uniref:STM4504/CBY_0614 family protein n=1 Tax=Azospirillum brasilense TaxID=192 RepID=UPI001EDA87C4|nr:hypothetical protein [Azospirillum brasilense]UKJ74440.1 hypothetical protein H1Q64_17895 [Azospirillum brasilense]
MPVFETFSKRRDKKIKAGSEDVYIYEPIPNPLRVQVIHILKDALTSYYGFTFNREQTDEAWSLINDTLKREKGVLALTRKVTTSPSEHVTEYILNGETDDFLDAVDLSFKVVHFYLPQINEYEKKRLGIKIDEVEAVKELNARFREHGIGYEFVNGQLIQISNRLLHVETVLPAIRLLHEEQFEGADQEIRNAFEHYKRGEFSDAIVDAHSAFESVLKSICDGMGWDYPKNAPGANILNIAKNKGLFPDYLDNSFDQLISVLKSGLPKVRNEEGGHGQGKEIKETPRHVASFALHLAATKIVFLVDAYREMKISKGRD